MQIIIRQENNNDIAAVRHVNELAFGQDNEAKLVDALRKSDAFVPELSLVAILNDEIIGHILFSKIKILGEHERTTESLALAPMAVLPNHQQKGIGAELIKHGLAKARALNFKSVIVLGHEHYYPKFGFEPAQKWNIRSPYDVPSDVFMAIELIGGGLKDVSGLVVYPKEFDGV